MTGINIKGYDKLVYYNLEQQKQMNYLDDKYDHVLKLVQYQPDDRTIQLFFEVRHKGE